MHRGGGADGATSVNHASSTGRRSSFSEAESSLLSGGGGTYSRHTASGTGGAPALDRRASGANSMGPVWESDTMRALSDGAIVAFLQTACTIATSRDFDKWRHHPSLARNEAVIGKKINEDETSRYEVDMGFGLHVRQTRIAR